MITVLNSLNFLNSEKYEEFIYNLKKNSDVHVDSTVYIKMLQSDLLKINCVDINIIDFKEILSERKFLNFSIGRIKIDEKRYKQYIEKEIRGNLEFFGYNELDEKEMKKYRKYFLFGWITDYYLLLKGKNEFLNSLSKRDIPLIDEYKNEIPELFKKIRNKEII